MIKTGGSSLAPIPASTPAPPRKGRWPLISLPGVQGAQGRLSARSLAGTMFSPNDKMLASS
jgi:hypothetical protein